MHCIIRVAVAETIKEDFIILLEANAAYSTVIASWSLTSCGGCPFVSGADFSHGVTPGKNLLFRVKRHFYSDTDAAAAGAAAGAVAAASVCLFWTLFIRSQCN